MQTNAVCSSAMSHRGPCVSPRDCGWRGFGPGRRNSRKFTLRRKSLSSRVAKIDLSSMLRQQKKRVIGTNTRVSGGRLYVREICITNKA